MTLLYLLDEWPEPATSGAKVHDKIMLRCLLEDWQAVVGCWAITEEVPERMQELGVEVLPRHKLSGGSFLPAYINMLLANRPLHDREFLSAQAKSKLQALIARVSPSVIVLSSPRLAVIVPYLKAITQAKIVVDTHDVHVQRCESIYEALPAGELKERMKQRLLIRSYGIVEKEIYKQVDVAWALKQEDKDLLESFRSVRQVDIVPNVVDPDMMRDFPEESSGQTATALSCTFIGDYSYKPNEQCALELIRWFGLESVKETGATLYLIGVNPTPGMQRQAESVTNIVVTGRVDDLDDYYKPVDTVFLAPLLAGGGVKRKVIEAMACGCPVITTVVGAEGLNLVDGDTAEVCSIEEFPERIVKLANDRGARMKLALAAQDHINNSYGYGVLRARVRASLENLIGGVPDQGGTASKPLPADSANIAG